MIALVLSDAKMKTILGEIKPLSSLSKNDAVEIEQGFIRKICAAVNRKISMIYSYKLVPFCGRPKWNGQQFVVALEIKSEPKEKAGELSFKIIASQGELELLCGICLNDEEILLETFPFTPLVENFQLCKSKDQYTPIKNDTNQRIFIDMEWISGATVGSGGTTPEQVSEYAFVTDDTFYHSGFLQVNQRYINDVHPILLDKMKLSMETLRERHSSGKTFLEESKEVLSPMVSKSIREGRKPTFFSFGREDSKILRQVFSNNQKKQTYFVDVTRKFYIYRMGQMSILNGLGVTFTHDFSSDMDVKALCLIYDVFSSAKTVEESKNLQLAIGLNKMRLQSKQPEKLEIYLQYVLSNSRTKELLQRGILLAEKFQNAQKKEKSKG